MLVYLYTCASLACTKVCHYMCLLVERIGNALLIQEVACTVKYMTLSKLSKSFFLLFVSAGSSLNYTYFSKGQSFNERVQN